jgi:hypothetical protein
LLAHFFPNVEISHDLVSLPLTSFFVVYFILA